MTDLSVEENEALEAVDHIGYLIRRFATIKDREAGEHLVRDLATIRSAFAAREYSKQREGKLREALEKLSESAKQAQGIMADTYHHGEEERVDHLDGWLDEHCTLIEAALAENGDSDAD